MTVKIKSAIEVFHQLHEFVINYDADGQANLFSENALDFEAMPEKMSGKGITKVNRYDLTGKFVLLWRELFC